MADSIAAWQEMLLGSAEGVQFCLRFKLDMADQNKAMRDPVAYRCNLTPHWRTGTKVKVRRAVMHYGCSSACALQSWGARAWSRGD